MQFPLAIKIIILWSMCLNKKKKKKGLNLPSYSLPFLLLLLQYLLSTEQKAVSSATFSSFKLDDALGLMWKAHTASIAYGLPKFRDR